MFNPRPAAIVNVQAEKLKGDRATLCAFEPPDGRLYLRKDHRACHRMSSRSPRP
jgi:hypothetical protein